MVKEINNKNRKVLNMKAVNRKRAHRLDVFIKDNANAYYATTYKTEKGAMRAMDNLAEIAKGIDENLTFQYMLIENNIGHLYPVILVPRHHKDYPALISIAIKKGYHTI
jgi:hypothetical protein